MQTERQLAANPQTKPIEDCKCTDKWLLPSASTIAKLCVATSERFRKCGGI